MTAWPLSAAIVSEVCQTIAFPIPETSLSPEGLTRVSVTDCATDYQTGRPLLPVRGVTFDLPGGAEIVSVTLTPGALREIALAAPVEWGQPPNLPSEQPAARVAPDPAVYGGTDCYPDLRKPVWRTDPTGGRTLLSVQVPPAIFDPARNVLLAAGSVTVTVAFSEKAASPLIPSTAPAPLLAELTPSPLEPGPHTYAVVSTSELIDTTPGPWNLQALCQARARAGFTPAIVSVEWIHAHYAGPTPASRIRAFVQDAYATWGLRYLLLAGTFDLLPVQRLYVSFTDFIYNRTAEIPADALYFGCLDGTFDNNGNGRFGEATDGPGGGDVDLTAEVLVGRFPVTNALELAHMVRKTLRYEGASAQDLQPQAFLAEIINMGSLVYADGYMEELRFGSGRDGLSTLGFKTSAYAGLLNADLRLYDSDAYRWTTADALAYLNQNFATVNHMGHGATKQCVKIPLSLPVHQQALRAFTNDMPYFIYSQACNSGEFDTPDCFAEQIVTVSNAAFAAIMNAREGWEYPNVVGGFSHRYHRAFWDAALRGTATRLGEINEQSRRTHLALVSAAKANYWRWVYYELNLFGDPATPFAPAVNLTPPVIAHTPLLNTCDTQNAQRVTCTVEPIGIYNPDSICMVWRTDRTPGTVQTQRMTAVSGNLYEAVIPPQTENTAIVYNLLALNLAGKETRSPAAGDNTFFFAEPRTLTILGSPTNLGTPEPYYGTHTFASGLVATASAPPTVSLAADTRVSNTGFFGAGSVPQSGTNQALSFVIDTDSLLVWQWRREHRLTVLKDIGAQPPQTFWVAENTAFDVPAAQAELSDSNGTLYAFAEWRLDGARSPAAPALSNPAYGALVADTPHTLLARYLPADLDDDANGIADWWEVRYFGGNGQNPDSDVDGDGYTLREEFEDRSDPLASAVTPAPPVITFAPLAETQPRPGPFTLRAAITDTCAIASAFVRWHRKTGAWQTTPLLVTSNSVFEAQIGAESAPGDDFEYQLVATDPSGRSSQTDLFYLFLCYPVADTTRFHDLSLVALPTQQLSGTYMNLHNIGNADLVWSAQPARAETVRDPALPGWDLTSLGQSWSVSTNRFVSAPYALRSKLASSNTMSGPPVRATLTMAPAVIGPGAALTFDYWIHSEVDKDPARAFDGGIVEYSLDNGATFQQLKGPYTHTIFGWTYSPWTNGTPCLAGLGTEGWRSITFDFAKEYPGEDGFRGRTMLLRFHYGGDNNTDNEGWYIDNIAVRPIEWPRGFSNNIEPAYSYTIPAGANKRILWNNLPSAMDLRYDNLTVFLCSNDPAAPLYRFFWQVTIRDYPQLYALSASQSSNGDGLVRLAAAVADADGEPVSLAFDWSGDKGKTWQPAALTNLTVAVGATLSNTPPDRLANLATATNGVPLTNQLSAVWASRAVTPALTVNTQTLFRVTATNGYFGRAYTSAPFTVDNVPPLFAAGALTVSPLSPHGGYALTTNGVTLAWPPATDNPSPTLTYLLTDHQETPSPGLAVTSQTSLVTAFLSLSNALDRPHRFEVVARDPAGNASAPLTASLLILDAAADYDGDGLSSADEEIAGTSAADAADRFAGALSSSPGALTLSWPSAAGRLYTVEASPALQPSEWRPLAGCSDIPGTGLTLTVEIPATQTAGFFRIRVRLP